MARYSNVQTDFSGGLISDYILGRQDIKRVANSAREFTNFLPTLQGPATFRTGFKHVNELTDSTADRSVSTTLTLSTDEVYRVVFSNNVVNIYNDEGVLKDTVSTPYSITQVKDLRFSSETDELYITHPLHRPRRLYTTGSITTFTLQSSGSNFLYGDNLPAASNTTDVGPEDELLQSDTQVDGDDDWVLEEVVYDVEPFEELYTGSASFTVSNNESYVKIESSTNDFAPIVAASADLIVAVADVDDAQDDIVLTLPSGHGLLVDDQISITGSSNAQLNTTHTLTAVTSTTVTFVVSGYGAATTTDITVNRKAVATHYYVQYAVGEETFLGKVVIQATSSNYTLADPTDTVIYVDPSNSVVDIEDPNARLYLLDNFETTDAEDIKVLKNEGVPDNKIHLRSDTTIFNQGLVGSWVLVDDTRRAKELIIGGDRTTTRWVQIKEHLGTQDHPVEFNRGTYDNLLYTAGSVYKIYNTFTGPLYQMGPNVSGDLTTTTAVLRNDGNRTYTFSNGLGTDPDHALYHGSNPVTTESLTIANLSTQKQFDVVDCEPLIIEEYTASNTDGNLIIPPTTSEVTITQIANDVELETTESLFVETDVDRHFKMELPSGNLYGKCVQHISGSKIIVELFNALPKNKRDLSIENGGRLLSINFGAWYTGNFPRTVTKYEQRRVYGGTFTKPNYIFFSRADNEFSFQLTQDDKTVLDTDGISYALANQTAAITWLDSLKDLVIGTTGGIYRVVPNQYLYGVSPKTIRIELTQEEPCKGQAISVGTSIFYPDQSGSRLLEYKYDVNIQNSASNDITKLIYPTFVDDAIKKIVYQHTPQPRIWTLTEGGKLYCLAYHRQEEFYAWSKLEFQSQTSSRTYESNVIDVSVVARGQDDKTDDVYIIVERNNQIFTEVFNDRDNTITGWFNEKTTAYLDSYIVNEKTAYNVAPSKDVSSRFANGDLVGVVLDGVYKGKKLVSNGQVQIDIGVQDNTLIVGYVYEGTLTAMFPTWNGQNKPAFGAETQRVVSVKPLLIDSYRYEVGVGDDTKEVDVTPANTNYQKGSGFTGFAPERPIPGSTFGVDKLPTFKQTEPYSLTIAAIVTKSDLN